VIEDILKLIKLQAVDDKIRLWRKTAEEGPDKIAQARESLTALETEVESLSASLAEKRKRLRELETETTDLAERRKTNQVRLLKARNNDEYRAILKEGETIATMVSTRDDEGLTLIDAAERLEERLSILEADLKTAAADFATRSVEIEAILAEGRESEAVAMVEREELVALIPAALLGRYNTVAQNRDGQAMSPVRTGQCQACRLSVPPQMFNELQKGDKLMVCPNCARIMYWTAHPAFRDFIGEAGEEPVPEPAPEKPDGSRRGRKSKAKPAPEPEPEVEAEVDDEAGVAPEAEEDSDSDVETAPEADETAAETVQDAAEEPDDAEPEETI
jgi:predicted  nucleic acid-binding Zn-ribbon protein